jgi:hypothetical protein
VLPVESTEVEGLEAPLDTRWFEILADDDMQRVGPAYFVTDEEDFGTLPELRARHPSASYAEPADGAGDYGLVSNLNGLAKCLVPVTDDSAFYSRGARKAVMQHGVA